MPNFISSDSKQKEQRLPPSHPPLYYKLAISILKPLYRLQVWKRSHQRDNYQQEVAQRFGKQYPPRPVARQFDNDSSKDNHLAANVNKVIWCHAVSLGETNTAAPLLDVLLANGYQLWLTNTTQTGFARGASRFADAIEQGRMSHSYVPVDDPQVIATFLAHVQPVAALFIETELWANILTALTIGRIPSILVNGRLSESSFNSYQKISAVSKSMMQNLTLIIAQDAQSAKRFRQLGASSAQIRTAGSLKWVINTPKLAQPHNKTSTDNNDPDLPKTALIQSTLVQSTSSQSAQKAQNTFQSPSSRPTWVAASTHSGEEDIALSLQRQLLKVAELNHALLIIVPRHPERFDEVAALIKASGLTMARRSLDDAITDGIQVYLADSMGELMQWYKRADVALVGGSMVDIGGHNPVEPASVATPIVMGQYTQSCQSVVDKLASAGALYQPHNSFYQAIDMNNSGNFDNANDVSHPKTAKNSQNSSVLDDTDLIYQQLEVWLKHPELAEQAGKSAAEMTEQQQAVLSRQLTMIEEVIEGVPDSAIDDSFENTAVSSLVMDDKSSELL